MHACVSIICTCVLSDIRVYMYVQCVNLCMLTLIHGRLLCHLQVYHLMESIELVTTPGTNIRRLIVEDVIKSGSILSCWEALAHSRVHDDVRNKK